jgi:hypothetical protein
MLGRGVALLLGASLLLSGCVTDGAGTDFGTVSQKLGPPKPGQSRIVVLQEKRNGISLSLCRCDLRLDGSPIGQVTTGTYVYADRPAGRHQLVATELFHMGGETKRDFSTESGRTYFYLIKSSASHDAVTGMAMLGGVAGAVVGSVAAAGSDNPGPADFISLDEQTARTTLAELQLAD